MLFGRDGKVKGWLPCGLTCCLHVVFSETGGTAARVTVPLTPKGRGTDWYPEAGVCPVIEILVRNAQHEAMCFSAKKMDCARTL